LLVSVRSVAEAEAALAGGAALIDVKEPARGALGRADPATVAAVVRFVAGRRPVSAALGELLDAEHPLTGGLSFVKWGLAGYGRRPDWSRDLARAMVRVRQWEDTCQVVPVAYADWHRADAPPPAEVAAFAREHSCGAYLLDTWGKDGTTLLDWLTVAEVSTLCRLAGRRVALAGSLGPPELADLRAVLPTWFAVRGAACRGGRQGTVDRDQVRRLVELLALPISAATPAGSRPGPAHARPPARRQGNGPPNLESPLPPS
jgi:uncharacterized protein (UPF0264 family)